VKHAIAIGLMLAAGLVLADDARTQAEQRVRLAARLIADSPAAQRIQASGNPAAISHLDEGRLHLSTAEEALKAGDAAKARKSAEESLQHLGMARRLVPDQPSHQQALRQRHEQQLATVDRLVEAWRVRATGKPLSSTDSALLDATGLVSQARRLGEERRYDDSLRTLAAAEQRLLEGFTRLFASRELDYTPRAANPAEAYHDEMASYSGLSELVPVAVRELTPRADAKQLIERYLKSAQALHAQAQQRFEAGDRDGALANLRSAVMYVQRALSAAGVVTPAPTGSPP
jgi:hypothetical protein